MKTNVKKSYAVKTHEGGAAFPHTTAYQELRRSVLFSRKGERIITKIKGRDFTSGVSNGG